MSNLIMHAIIVALLIVTVEALTDFEWEAYKKLYRKHYETKLEDSIRRELLVDALEEINEFNLEQWPKVGYKIGLNQFSDLTKSELKRLGGTKSRRVNLKNSPEAEEYLNSLSKVSKFPSRLDWRLKPNRLGPIKDQTLSCRSSWAQAVTGLLEGQLIDSKRKRTRLSDQQLLDCVVENSGCRLGSIESALSYVQMNGIQTEYEYKNSSSKCIQSAAIRINGFASLTTPQNDGDYLKRVLANYGPIAGVLKLSNDLFKYKSGIFNDLKESCNLASNIDYQCAKINHAVLIVGYGTDSVHGDYWIVKNSWGKQWGEEGYFRIAAKQNSGLTCSLLIAIVGK